MKKFYIILLLLICAFSFNMGKVNALNISRVSNYQTTLAVDCNLLNNGNSESKTIKWLSNIYGLLKFLAPTLAVVFTIIEFFKAIIDDKKEALQTAAKRTMIRVILCLLIFFLPLIINFVFGTIFHMCGTQGIN